MHLFRCVHINALISETFILVQTLNIEAKLKLNFSRKDEGNSKKNVKIGGFSLTYSIHYWQCIC